MKKQLLVLALSLFVGLGTTFAKEGVNEKIVSSFQKDFAAAQNVQWGKSATYTKATFKLNDQVLFAYYSEEGSLLAVTRNLVTGQLPINLLADLKKNYSAYWISDLFEMSADNETSYYVTVENGDYTTVLKSTGTNGWEVYKKDKKEVIQ